MATILVVDDTALNRTLLKSVLSRTDHRLLEAENGEEGLGIARVEFPDLVVADILMPKMDGYEFVRELRNDPSTSGCAVIFWTAAYVEDEVRSLADRCGVKHVLSKPADPKAILDLVETVLAETPAEVSLVPDEEFRREHLQLLNEKLLEQVRRLEESEGVKTAILKSALDAIVSMDHEGSIAEFNPAAETMFGYERAAVIGKPLAEMIIPPGLRQKHQRGLSHFLATGEAPVVGRLIELTGMASDGREFPIELTVIRVDLPGPALFTGFLRDITDRKAAEEQVQAYALDLKTSLSSEKEKARELEDALEELRSTTTALRKTDEERKNLLAHLVMAQEEERKRIASDVHDDSIQVMAAVGVRLGMMRKRVTDPDQLNWIAKLDEAVQLSIGRLRHLLFQLAPPALERAGLVAALNTYLDEAFGENRIQYNLRNLMGTEPKGEIRAFVYRIAQEALSNVRKHAQATQLEVRLQDQEGGLLVEIRDDGLGWSAGDSEVSRPGHLGLVSMRERAEMLGGWFRIEGEPGVGTSVKFWVPTHDDGNSAA